MAQLKPGRQSPNAEDIQRLGRLSEEIRGRLLEIALILSRNADVKLKTGSKIGYVQRDRKVKTRGDWVEVIVVDGVEACYGVIGGEAFAESPCGG